MESRIIPFSLLCPSPPPTHEEALQCLPCPSSSNWEPAKPRKKRSKVIKLGVGGETLCSNPSRRRKYNKKPDPFAPKITEPCSECGKKFWSRKALFGHMRCHPERQWRGINPPPSYRRPMITTSSCVQVQSWDEELCLTAEEREVASCLMMLSNAEQGEVEKNINNYYECFSSSLISSVRFECSSCKKVFGSHQALGGHRASHKNVKGCFAMMSEEDVGEHESVVEVDDDQMMMMGSSSTSSDHGKGKELVVWGGHKCSVCLRVFSSGQALGGHMRCHWEERLSSSSSEQAAAAASAPSLLPIQPFPLDLNLPRPTTHHHHSFSSHHHSYSSCTLFPNLDLRLRL